MEADMFKIAIALFAIGGAFIWQGIWGFEMKRLIENTPTSKIRSLAMGLVETVGTVVPTKPVVSPFSGATCAYCSWVVQEYRGGKHKSWVTIRKGVEGKEFTLRDDTGEVLVDPEGATVEIPIDYEVKATSFTPKIEQALTGMGVSSRGMFGARKDLRCQESYLAPGDTVYVLGTAKTRKGAADFQRNEDGIVIAHAPRSIFYISDKREKDVLVTMRWRVAGLYAGVVMVIAGIGVLLSLFGFT